MDENGWTDLHWAALHDSTEAASWLLKRGAEVNARTRTKKDDLGWEQELGAEAQARLSLLGLSSSKDRWRGESSPLMFALKAKSPQVAELLLASGADVGARDADGATALHSAAESDSVTVAKLLLASGVEANVRTDGDWTPLHDAAARDSVTMAELLLAGGAEVNARDHSGLTPLDRAMERDSEATADRLRRHGAVASRRRR